MEIEMRKNNSPEPFCKIFMEDLYKGRGKWCGKCLTLINGLGIMGIMTYVRTTIMFFFKRDMIRSIK